MEPELYEETLYFRVFQAGDSTHRTLIPSELDLAVATQQLTRLEEEVERLEDGAEPSEIRRARETLKDAQQNVLKEDPLSKEGELAFEQIRTWEASRMAQLSINRASIFRMRKRLDRMVRDVDDAKDKQDSLETRIFLMREMPYGAHLQADEKHSTWNETTAQREVQAVQRDLDLFRLLYRGERKSEGVEQKEVEELQSTIAQTLINRMWGHNQMDPDLASFFR